MSLQRKRVLNWCWVVSIGGCRGIVWWVRIRVSKRFRILRLRWTFIRSMWTCLTSSRKRWGRRRLASLFSVRRKWHKNLCLKRLLSSWLKMMGWLLSKQTCKPPWRTKKELRKLNRLCLKLSHQSPCTYKVSCFRISKWWFRNSRGSS